MNKNKKEEQVKRIQLNISRYLIYTADPQYLIDLKNNKYKKFIELIHKSKNDAIDLKKLLADVILELDKDIDFLSNLGQVSLG